jgi:hypothetical protein
MKTVTQKQKYGESTPFEWLDNYEFCLYRLDWSAIHMVFFNRGDSVAVLHGIMEGEILVHHNYSLLYCRDEAAEKIAPNFGCHTLIHC